MSTKKMRNIIQAIAVDISAPAEFAARVITVTIPFRVFAINSEKIPEMEESYSKQMRDTAMNSNIPMLAYR